jgi:hypothetical protein
MPPARSLAPFYAENGLASSAIFAHKRGMTASRIKLHGKPNQDGGATCSQGHQLPLDRLVSRTVARQTLLDVCLVLPSSFAVDEPSR